MGLIILLACQVLFEDMFNMKPTSFLLSKSKARQEMAGNMFILRMECLKLCSEHVLVTSQYTALEGVETFWHVNKAGWSKEGCGVLAPEVEVRIFPRRQNDQHHWCCSKALISYQFFGLNQSEPEPDLRFCFFISPTSFKLKKQEANKNLSKPTTPKARYLSISRASFWPKVEIHY